MDRRSAIWATFLALAAGCATPNVAVNPRADFRQVHRVAVVQFGGPQGDAAAELLTQSLVSYGADVVERRQLEAVIAEHRWSAAGLLNPKTMKRVGGILGVDALFLGTVVRSLPSESYLVSNAPNVTQVVHISRPNVSPGMTVGGVPNAQVVTAPAAASLVCRMVDVQTGSILWSGSMSYDAQDTAEALRVITDALVKSLAPVWPGIRLKTWRARAVLPSR